MHWNNKAVCRFVLTTVLIGSASLVSSIACGENWPRFRGPNGSGLSDDTTIPVEWTVEDYVWKIALPGSGISSPVVWDNKAFVTSADLEAQQRFLLAVDINDGKLLWQREFAFQKHPKHKNNSYATSTPTVDAERVYVVWQGKTGSSIHAYSHGGDEIWQYDLGPFEGNHGPATSPIIYNDLLIYANDQEQDSCLLALEAKTGKVRWKIPREDDRACYSTPCIFTAADGSDSLVFTHSYRGITGHDPLSGEQRWEVVPFGKFQQRAIGSPVVAGELIIGGSGFTTGERNVVAVQPVNEEGKYRAREVYRVSKFAPHIPTPLVYRDWLFLWDDRGIVACVDKATGEDVWVKRVGGSYYSSPICISGKLYCVDLDGNVVVIAAADKYELLARNSLGKPTSATPAVAGGKLIFRTESELMAVSGKK